MEELDIPARRHSRIALSEAGCGLGEFSDFGELCDACGDVLESKLNCAASGYLSIHVL